MLKKIINAIIRPFSRLKTAINEKADNLKMRNKLISIVLIVFASFLLSVSFSIYSVNKVKIGSVLYDQINNFKNSIAKLSALKADLIDLRMTLLTMAAEKNKDKISQHKSKKEELEKLIDERFASLEKEISEADVLTAIKDVKKICGEFRDRANTRFMPKIDAADPSGAADVLMTGAMSLKYKQFIDQTDSSIGISNRKIKELEDGVAATVGRNIASIIATSGVMLLIVLIFAMVITRSITLSLSGIMGAISRIKNGDLSEKHIAVSSRKDEIGLMARSFEELIHTIDELTGEMHKLTSSAILGKLDTKCDIEKFNGDYRELAGEMNNLIDAISRPVNEMLDTLSALALNDTTIKLDDKEYHGVWGDIRQAVSMVRDRFISTTAILTGISAGDLSSFDDIKSFGRFSANDEMTPAMIKMMESIKSVITDINKFAEAGISGDLNFRADAAAHSGEFAKIIIGVNETLDAILSPVREAAACLSEMAKGNLAVAVRGDYKGDHAIIKNALNLTIDSMSEMIYKVSDITRQVGLSSKEVSNASKSLSETSSESASSLEEISATMQQINSQSRQNAANAGEASNLAARARTSAGEGDVKMKQLQRAMADINQASADISKIIKTIDEIAFQTNLLALNAAVEAARAGKHGKGFTVVAEEVRNLAQRSAKAAKETEDMIANSVKKTQAGTRIAEDTSRSLETIVEGSAKVTDLIKEIAAASKEQESAVDQINAGLVQIDNITQQNTATAEETASASTELYGRAVELKQMIDQFKLSSDYDLETVDAYAKKDGASNKRQITASNRKK